MISVRVDGKPVLDATSISWSSTDPGGFEACSFTTSIPVNPGDEIYIRDGLAVCFHGIVEEPGLRSVSGQITYNVGGVGYSANLKQGFYSMVYIDRNLSEFKPMPLQRDIALSGGQYVQEGSFQVASGEASDGKPSLILAFDSLQNTAAAHIGIVECWYDSGYGNAIDEVHYSYETYDKSGGGLNQMTSVTWTKKILITNNEIVTFLDQDIFSTTNESNLTLMATDTNRRYALVQLFYNGTQTVVGNWKLIMEHVQFIGTHGLPLRGVFPDQGFYPSDIVKDAISRTRLVFDTVINSAVSYIIPQLVFRELTSADTIIDTASKFVGWHWGVWEPQTILSDRPTFYFVPPPEEPTDFVRYEDCENVDLTEHLSGMYNRAVVNYTLPNGNAGNVVVTTSHPRLSENVTQTIIFDVGTVGSIGVAKVIGLYQLNLLKISSRVAGSLSLSAPLNNGLMPHLLRPGRNRLKILGLPGSSSQLSSEDSFRVQRISVNVSDNGVPTTQVEFDHGADLIEVLQARLANAQEASNLGG